MSYRKSLLIRFVASCVYIVRRRSIQKSTNRFVVVTGSVGKTITRQTLAEALRRAGQPVASPQTSYVNEMGILCTLFGVEHFSMRSPKAWWQLLRNQPLQNTYICIELGADFRTDIDWFLRRFDPYAALVTPVTTFNWTGVVPQVAAARARLTVRAACVFSFAARDAVGPDRFYEEVVTMAAAFLRYENIPVPTSLVPYTEGRWGMKAYAHSAVMFDTYKVTPLCLTDTLMWCLAARECRKISIMTEIRPSLIPLPALYEPVRELLAQIDEVYVVGDCDVYQYVSSFCRATYVTAAEVPMLKHSLQTRIETGEALRIGVKTAAYYEYAATLGEW